VYALSGWIPSVMIQRGESFAAGFGFGAIMQVASFLGALVGAYLIDRTGAAVRWMAVLWMGGGVAVSLLTILNTHLLNTVFVAVAGFGIPGAQFLLNNYTARSYETSIRASGVGMELAVGRLGAILGPYIAGVLQQMYHSSTPMFAAVAVAALVAGCTVLTLSASSHGIPVTDPKAGPLFSSTSKP
jgi:cyanate permease